MSTTGLLTIFFSAEPVRDYAGAAACDLEAYGAWCRALLERGVYPPPSQFEAWFPSLAHTDEQVDRTLAAAADAFAEARGVSALDRLAATVRGRGGLLAAGRRGVADGASTPHGDTAAAGPRAAADPGRATPCSSRRSGRATSCTTARAAWSPPTTPTSRCWPATSSTPSAWRELAELGDLDAVGELADVISLTAAAQAVADEDLAEAVWEAGAVAVGWGATPGHVAAKALRAAPATRAPPRPCARPRAPRARRPERQSGGSWRA